MRKAQLIFWSLASVFIAYLIYDIIQDQDKKNRILNDLQFTKGYMIQYEEVGEMESPYVTYNYLVNNKFYKGSVSSPSFSICEHDFSKCKNKQFWVAYEKSNPSNSAINLDIEIQDLKRPVPPNSFEGFRVP
jgi:hypothetical protein